MDVIRTAFCFDDFNTFPFAEISQDFPDICFQLSVYDLSVILRGKYQMVLAK